MSERNRYKNLPGLSVHVLLHDHVAVDAEHSSADFYLVFQQFGNILTWLQQKHIRRVCQKNLQRQNCLSYLINMELAINNHHWGEYLNKQKAKQSFKISLSKN